MRIYPVFSRVEHSNDERVRSAHTVKSSGAAGGKKKLSAFNRYMKSEMARLKESHPNITHQDRYVFRVLVTSPSADKDDIGIDRFKMATTNWRTAKENPKNDP